MKRHGLQFRKFYPKTVCLAERWGLAQKIYSKVLIRKEVTQSKYTQKVSIEGQSHEKDQAYVIQYKA